MKQTEWVTHERNIHMPEELWICCPRLENSSSRCPFCAHSNPSKFHLKDHNYFSCHEKSLSERTFNRKDHFLQHVVQMHVDNVSAGQKPVRLTELSEAWRRPLNLEQGHQALHCGFCGLSFQSYHQRTEHVSKHFMSGSDMISWWSARLSHEITPSVGPVQANP